MTDTTNAVAHPQSIPADSEELALLRKIDTTLGTMNERLVNVEKVAIRNGAAAGAVAGGLTGGIVAAGIAFARAKLGL